MPSSYGPPEAYKAPGDPYLRHALVIFGIVLLLIASSVGVLVAINYVGGRLPPSSGLVGSTEKQNVQGDGGAWVTLCKIPNNSSSCVQVSGLEDVGSSGLAVITFTNGQMPAGGFGIGVLNLTLGTWAAHLSTNCSPFDPYYPGQGTIVYVACWGSSSSSVIEFDPLNASVLGAFPVSSPLMAWGYDPGADRLYLGLSGGKLLAVNPTTGATLAERSIAVPGSESGDVGVWSYLSWSLVYDPFTNLLLSQADSNNLIAFDPLNLTEERLIPTGATPWAMSMDSANEQLYLSTGAGVVLAYNATSFAQVANISVSSSICGNGGEPFLADQMILDPAHGDLYLQSFWYCLGIVNTTGDYAVTTISWGGDGDGFAVYNPATRYVWSYYPDDVLLGPVYVRLLLFSTYPVLVSVLYLPPSIGETLIVAAIWLVGVYGIYLLHQRFKRKNDVSANASADEPKAPGGV